MIICNECGKPLTDGLSFCTECGKAVPRMGGAESLDSTMWVIPPPVPDPQPDPKPSPIPQPSPPIGLLVLFGMMAIFMVAVVVYFAARAQSGSTASSATLNSNDSTSTSTDIKSSPTTVTNMNSSTSTSPAAIDADALATSLNTAVDNGRLVTLTSDDAYTYFTQLKAASPQHPALASVKSRVLPKLRSTGEEIINRRVNHTGEVSEQDWMTSVRVYEWAHLLEPGDRALGARQKYVQGKLAEARDKRSEAWQAITLAAQLDSSWAVPPNDLGLLMVEDKVSGKQKWSNAIPYYRRAMALQPGWEIPFNNMGTAYYYLEDYDTAEGFYRQAIQRNSNWARPHKWLGDVYVKKGTYGAAIGEYQTAVNLYNPNTDSLDIASIQKKIAQLRASGY